MIRALLQRLLGRRRALNCDQVMEVLQSYLDGETDAETVRRVSTHLDACADCFHESAVYRRIKASLANPAEGVDPAILARLEQFVHQLPH